MKDRQALVLQEEPRRHDDPMQQSGPALLVFDRDGWIMAFPHLEDAANWRESMDVPDGEYEGAFTLDGSVVGIAGVRR